MTIDDHVKLSAQPRWRRMSALPFTEYCGKAARLSAQFGAGRPAAMSTAFHAKCSAPNDPETHRKLALLTAKEREEIEDWNEPEPFVFQPEGGKPMTLHYADAEKELEVALSEDGAACKASDPACIAVGHLDFGWVVNAGGKRYAITVDIKRSVHTVTEGPESLQLTGYGFAYALKHDCTHYLPVIWAAMEGQYIPAAAPIALDDFEASILWSRLEHAASNDSEAAPGSHCLGCYARMHCDEHMLPAALAAQDGSLAAFATGGPPLTEEKAIEGLVLASAFEEAAKALKAQAKAFAINENRGILFDKGNGKRYVRVICEGRRSGPSVKKLEEMGKTELITVGAPFDTWRWKKK